MKRVALRLQREVGMSILLWYMVSLSSLLHCPSSTERMFLLSQWINLLEQVSHILARINTCIAYNRYVLRYGHNAGKLSGYPISGD